MLNKKIIEFYKKHYNLSELKNEERVELAFFDKVKGRHDFIVVVIYNEKREHLLLRDFNKSIGWELPGGYLGQHERIEDAVNRIVTGETGLEIDELRPIALVKNVFLEKKERTNTVIHCGIAFMALSRKQVKPYPKNIMTVYSKEIPEKVAYQNNAILNIARSIIDKKHLDPPYAEIESVNKFFFFYLLNKYVVKIIGNIASRKIKRRVFDLIFNQPKTLLDPSCGDCSIAFDIKKHFGCKLCVCNDICWKTISLIKNKDPGVFFTNHNTLNLPFVKKFDLVVFKNTLHHIRRENQKNLISKLVQLSSQLIIVDIEDPQKTTLLAKVWNYYYRMLLGDQGETFLTYNEFKEMIQSVVKNKKYIVGKIKTIKGPYFYASIF